MSDLSDFIKQHNLVPNKGRKTVLAPYEDEIFEMKSMGFTEKIILQFLEEKKGVTVTQQTLNWFIRSRSEKSVTGKTKRGEPKPADTATRPAEHEPHRITPKQPRPQASDGQQTQLQKKPLGNTEQGNGVPAGKPRKFEWGELPSDEVLFGSSNKSDGEKSE